MSRFEIKEKAKASLKGKYGDVILLMIISAGISFALGIILSFLNLNENVTEIVSVILSIIESGIIGFGTYSYYLKISRNEDVNYKELFSKVNLFFPYIIITLLVAIFVSLWSLLFIIPGIIAAISYSQVYFIKLDNPELGFMDVIKKSKDIMNGHKWDYFVLGLSFIGWIIIGIFTLGILYIWLIPYMQVTYANFYNELNKAQ